MVNDEDRAKIHDRRLALSEIEENIQIWELPLLLSEISLYPRILTPVVIVEGWLCKKSSNRMSMQWHKR